MSYQELYEQWLHDPRLAAEDREELEGLRGNDKELEYRFGGELEFGTAGMRGLIGCGTNMMNVYTVRRATRGLAEYIGSLGKEACARGVAISYDTRKNSRLFAEAAASVLGAYGIRVYLFTRVHPVPMLSYAVRKLGTVAGIMITASHNPKEYNGYKVYGEDGAQMSPEATKEVVAYISKITDYLAVPEGGDGGLVGTVPASVDDDYIAELSKLTLSKGAVERCGKNIKLVYTPVHGSGYVPVMRILEKLGIHATVVEEQTSEDPAFSTVAVPNPEYKETLAMGIALAEKIGADVVFGTDPDSDRLGVAVRSEDGEYHALSGNQVGILLLDYILTRLKEEGTLPKNAAVVKSFVSTGMAALICREFGVALFETPVGFKFIGEKIKLWEQDGSHTFVFGFEESCGYLRGTHARDKDAVVASMLFAEMVCYYTDIGKSVYGRLMEIYRKYGYVLDCNISVQYAGLNAMKEMNAVVDALKSISPKKFGPFEVEAVRDYSASVRRVKGGKEETLDIPKCNCVYYELAGGGFICVRPSGTEPKLKIYYSVKAESEEKAQEVLASVRDDVTALLRSAQE